MKTDIDPRDAIDGRIRTKLRELNDRGSLWWFALVYGWSEHLLRDLMSGTDRLTVDQRSALVNWLD